MLVSLAVKNGTGRGALPFGGGVCCVWLILLACFLLFYFLDTQNEHMFVAVEAGSELPMWQPPEMYSCTHKCKGRCWSALSTLWELSGEWWCGHCQSRATNKSALIRDELRLSITKVAHGKVIYLDKSGF